MVEPPQRIMEVREDVMISPNGGKPTSKMSHFIKPMLNSSLNIPELPSVSNPFRPVLQRCTFNGWRNPNQQWVSWVDKLHSSYESVWKRAGVYEAILCSKCRIVRNEELFFGLVERWCSETNTFVFCWGEASVTLEDLFVLGGFSVAGDSVSGYGENKDVTEVEKKLDEFRKRMFKGGNQCQWMKHFMGSGSEIEHEAFLAMWLSRFVLPTFPFDTISKRFFRIAIWLSRGVPIALAPVVLASIYRDLSLLKSVMQSGVCNVKESGKDGNLDEDLFMITLWAPLQFVQVWAWERFPEFRPKPRRIDCGEPRLARWHLVNEADFGNVRPLLQSAGGSFEWRPYCKRVDNWSLPSYCIEEERWFLIDSDLGVDFQAFIRFLRVCELVGMDTIEQYNPHRVAMQFGFDQDVPLSVRRSLIGDGIPKRELVQLAWLSYIESTDDQLLYVPSISYEPQVTFRYLKWIRAGVLAKPAALEGVVRKKRNSLRSRRVKGLRLFSSSSNDDENLPPRKSRKCADYEANLRTGSKPRMFIDHYTSDDSEYTGCQLDVSPGAPPETNAFKNVAAVAGALSSKGVDAYNIDVPEIAGNNLDVPPGFSPKSDVCKNVGVVPSRFHSKSEVGHNIDAPPGFLPKTIGNDLDVPPGFPAKPNPRFKSWPQVHRKQGSTMASLVEVKKECFESIDIRESSLGFGNQTSQDLTAGRNEQTSMEIASTVSHGTKGEIDRASHGSVVSDAEARIRQLEKIVAALKAEK